MSRRRAALLTLGVLLLVAVVAWLAWPRTAAPDAFEDPWAGPVPVKVVAALKQDVALRIKAIGTVTPLNTVTVRARVDGQLLRVHFTEGEPVRAGQLLAEIDPSVYRARLAEAEGQQAQNLAQLKLAEHELALYQGLLQRDAIARQQVEKQQALVEQLRGTRRVDQAQVEQARLQLAWTRIEAPIAGRAGLRKVDAGNLVAATDTQGLLTITQTQPITVVFSVPEAHVAALREARAAGLPLTVEAWDRGEARRLALGRLSTIDNQIDVATGSLRLKAQFDDADDALFPNQFVNARLTLGHSAVMVTIPVDAVQYASQGPYVYVIDKGQAKLRRVVPGPAEGERIAITEGLAAGEEVVLEGLDRLRDGKPVVLVNGATSAASSATP